LRQHEGHETYSVLVLRMREPCTRILRGLSINETEQVAFLGLNTTHLQERIPAYLLRDSQERSLSERSQVCLSVLESSIALHANCN
jgi:hypothetical protein